MQPTTFLLLSLSGYITAVWGDETVNYFAPKRPIATIEIVDNFYGNRNVSYWLTPDGLAVIDGDIIYGTEHELLANRVDSLNKTSPHLESRAFSFPVGRSKIWPDSIINWKFDSDDTESYWAATVQEAISRWTERATYLDFRQLANDYDARPGILTIRSIDCGGCIASHGKEQFPYMYLEKSCSRRPAGGGCSVETIAHEFGHVLGLLHEHQRPDRNRYVTFTPQSVDPQCPPGITMPSDRNCGSSSGIPAGCCLKLKNFDPLTSTLLDSSGPYDLRSLMHYPETAFARPGFRTLEGKDGRQINPGTVPSSLDIARIYKLYFRCPALGCSHDCEVDTICLSQPSCGSLPRVPRCCPVHTWSQSFWCLQQREICRRAGCRI